MNQPNLFQPEQHARVTDPDTSHQAAESVIGNVGQQKAEIIAILGKWGPMSAEQIAAVSRTMRDNVAVARRTADLRDADLIRDSGKRAFNRSGRQAIVWALRR